MSMMRISTAMLHQLGLRTMTGQEAKMNHAFEQVASGRRVLTPADDPLAAAQSITVAQTQAQNLRYDANRSVAMQNLRSEEDVLNMINSTLHDIRVRIVEAGNGTYSDVEMKTLATDLRAQYETLLSRANATDGTGQHLFSGHKGNVAPYQIGADGLRDGGYLGDAGRRLIQTAETRQMDSADTAPNVFARANPGSPGYVASAPIHPVTGSDMNTGNITFGSPVIVGQPDGDGPVSITFEPMPAGSTTPLGYRISWTNAAGTAVSEPPVGDPATSYDPIEGATITANGVQIALQGTPAAGDEIQLESFAETNMDVFSTLEKLIGRLEQGSATDADKAAMQNAINEANRKITNNQENISTVRATVGTRMAELSSLDDEGANRNLNYRSQLSRLEDVDMREAIIDLTTRSMALQAAELAYMRVQNLGLFNRG